MSLLVTQCIFRRLILRKPWNHSFIHFPFMTYQFYTIQLKCFQSNFKIVSTKIPTSYSSKRHLNITATLKMSKNYYDILGVPRNANQKQIKDAYYKLAMKYHPDKNQGKLTQQFREIKEAYDILNNASSRMKYNNSSNNHTGSSNNNWSSNSSYERYKPNEEYTWTNNRTKYTHSKREHTNDYHLKSMNIFINIIKVPKNVVKTQIDLVLIHFIKNSILKLILFQLFQFIWTQVLNNLNYNVLISSTSPNSLLDEFIRRILTHNTVRIELTKLEAIKGKAVRLHVNDNEKVLVVNIPQGVNENQSFYLFYLLDEEENNTSYKH